MLFNKLTIIGVGLIGGSLARALKAKKLCAEITGFGRAETNLKKAVELGVIDNYSLNIKTAVADADVVVLATPLTTVEPLLKEVSAALKPEAIVTDVGSAKSSVVDAAMNTLGETLPFFVPGHPIAGREKSGVQASLAELFENHIVILTPLPETKIHALSLVTQMWESVGANVINLKVEHHDQVLAATSHLPHMLAYALVDCLAAMQERDEIFQFAAGGFADFSRIASSNPEMWHDVCFSNRESLLKVLESFDSHLSEIKAAISEGDSDTLLKIFSRAKKTRDDFEQMRSQRNRPNEIE